MSLFDKLGLTKKKTSTNISVNHEMVTKIQADNSDDDNT